MRMQRRRFNMAQRLVVVFGLGAVFYLIGGWVTSLDSAFGWVGYAPLSTGSSTFRTSSFVGGFHPWVRFVIWFLLIAVWVGVSLTLLRSPPLEITSDEPL
jgi:hypothetical protein